LERAPAAKPRRKINGVNGHSNGYVNGNGNGITHVNGNGATSSDRSFVYLLSAKAKGVAETMAKNFAAHVRQSLESGDAISTDDLAYTLATRRSMFPWMVAVPAKNLNELADRWESPATKIINAVTRPVKRLGFVFNGQGAQWHAMARELLHSYPVFSQSIQEATDILMEYGAKWSLYGTSLPFLYLGLCI
jgi:acyl transferase domain-containing protein